MASRIAQNATVVAKTAAKFSGTIGDMIDSIYTLRELKRRKEEEIAAIEGEYHGIEAELMERLGKEGLGASRGSLASVSISTSVSANVTDWDMLNKYIKKTGYFHLYQRRLSDPAFRELLEQKGVVPGVEPFSKKRLNVRSL